MRKLSRISTQRFIIESEIWNTYSLASFTSESFRNVSRMEKRFLTFDMTRQDDFAIEYPESAECRAAFSPHGDESERVLSAMQAY